MLRTAGLASGMGPAAQRAEGARKMVSWPCRFERDYLSEETSHSRGNAFSPRSDCRRPLRAVKGSNIL